ncbi:MAG: Nif3-like dinuclear metal center hexameric protein [Oscillospiraceae bacterium]|jgi:dinuclear metal center YbgI/SA1388 family protein|nr:Nif3-like dinuclear metal center hexameric protein [Oscillospiraceae bacterium]
MTIRDVYMFLDSFAPFATQLGYDNAGLEVGDFDNPVQTGLLCLDVTADIIAQAQAAGAQLIISHHPVLFAARKQLPTRDPAYLLAKAGIAALSAHTNYDAAPGGVSDLLAARLRLANVVPLSEVVRTGNLATPIAPADFAAKLAALGWHTRWCDGGQTIAQAAVCGGGGAGELHCVHGRAQAYVTGDADHHHFLDAQRHGISLFACGHFETEILAMEPLAARLRAAFPAIGWRMATEKSVVRHA